MMRSSSGKWTARSAFTTTAPKRVLEIHSEITALKRAEENFRNLLEFAPDAIVIIREDGQIAVVNAQTEKIFGYGREELLGQHLDILIPARFRSQHAQHRAG